ncbi:transketolase family protein [Glaciecola sp. KUL10]|uniref:transketolase family protein n=1 Tax=Glaciecola sp. (strain KUL10) TaxID=2161813 RepID=UPI000D810725|nr:transketolase C-terminal domain-containing protein [Glaciecola sp. KUL10]GBL04008.1 transketolase, alpha subunit [Glaciecola sp. KUL10]
MKFDAKTAKRWSKMGIRAVYGKIVSTLAKENENVLLMSADLGRSSGLASFYSNYPERFVNVGIAEQNMIGVAAGLSRCEYNVFASTFAPFATMRAAEQVRMNMGYMKEPVKLIGLGSGLSMAFLGNSHFGLEDVSVMRAIPGLTILSPADGFELALMIEKLSDYDQPCYVRLTGAPNYPVVFEERFDFQIGKSTWVRPKAKVNILSTGTTSGHALSAIDLLANEGTTLGLLHLSTLKPIDEAALIELVKDSEILFVCEEHTKIGGLYSIIAELIVKYSLFTTKIINRSLPDEYLETGDYEYLLNLYGLDAHGIKSLVMEHLS